MSEIIRCATPTCNSLFRVDDCREGTAVPCPICRQFTEIPRPPAVHESDSSLAIRGPLPYFLLVCVLLGGVLSCLSAWGAIFVLWPNELGLIYGAGTVLVIQFALSGGLLAGSRLARLATRIIGALWLLVNCCGICLAIASLFYLYTQQQLDLSDPAIIPPLAMLVLEIVRVLLVAALLLHLNSADALRYFGIACPLCGDLHGQPADLFLHRIRCPSCRFQWTG